MKLEALTLVVGELHVLHFYDPGKGGPDDPVAAPVDTPWRHYVGRTKVGVAERLAKHRNGDGSRLVKWMLAHGYDFVLGYVETVYGKGAGYRRERQLKNRGGFNRFGPLCAFCPDGAAKTK